MYHLAIVVMFLVTLPIDINMPTRGLLADLKTKSSFVFMVGTFE